jgi:hypothetical protein
MPDYGQTFAAFWAEAHAFVTTLFPPAQAGGNKPELSFFRKSGILITYIVLAEQKSGFER